MSKCVVVGGGVAGLVAAYLLSKQGRDVVLIEQSERCGGLLNSVTDGDGNYFDQGTHIPNLTGIDELDSFLFGSEAEQKESWLCIPQLKTGNYFANKWDYETQTIDARKLPLALYEQGIGQLISRNSDSSAANIQDYSKDTLGPIFFENLVKPVIDKLYGPQSDYTKLTARNSVNYFGATRVIALDEAATEKLKELPVYDTKLGYHKHKSYQERLHSDGIPEPSYLYPKSAMGMQAWVDKLVNKVKQCGVEIKTQCIISSLHRNKNKITEVRLKSGEEISCDLLYWSAPPFIALKAMGMQTEPVSVTFRTAHIYHFCLDKPLKDKNSHYLWSWDESSPIFRITLYGNFNSLKQNQITAEVLADKSEKELPPKQIFEDLIAMNLINANASLQSYKHQVIHNTFPVPTFEFEQNVIKNYNALKESAENIIISGRFSGKYWLLCDVLVDTFKIINRTLSDNH